MKEKKEYITDRDFVGRKRLRDTFTNRFSLISEIEKVLNQEPPIPIIVFFGLGGIGKTYLVHYIREKFGRDWQESPEGYPHAYISLRSDHTGLNVADVLESLGNQIKIYWPQFTFPRFDFILKKFGERIHRSPQSSDSKVRLELQLIGEIGLGKIFKVGQLFESLVGRLNSYLLYKKTRPWFIENLEIPFGVRYQDAINQITLGEILRLLPKAFAADVAHTVNGMEPPFNRVILLVDNYELLEANTREYIGKQLPSFVQQLAEEIVHQKSGILLLIAGKDRLHWADIRLNDGTYAVDVNSIWSNSIIENTPTGFSSSSMIQRLIGNLSKEDSYEYLKKKGFLDQKIIEDVYALTSGYPLGLCTAADLITQASDRASEELSILRSKVHNFPLFSFEWKEELCGWILERLLEQLKDQNREPLRALVRIASIPRWFNEDLLFNLTKLYDIQDQFNQLINYNFVESFSIKLPSKTIRAYRLKVDVRRFLLKTIRVQQQLHELNAQAKEYFRSLMDVAKSPEERFLYELEFLYHFTITEPEQGLQRLEFVFEDYLEEYRIDFCESILQMLRDLECYSTYDKAKLYLMTGRYYTTIAEYATAYENLREANSLEPLTNGFEPHRVAIVQSFAECCRLIGKNYEALKYWQDILELANEHNEPCSKFLALWGQSLTYKLLDEVPKAYQLCEQTSNSMSIISKQCSPTDYRKYGIHGFATKEADILRHKAELFRCLGDYANASICCDKFRSLLVNKTLSLAFAYGLLVSAHISRMEGNAEVAINLMSEAKIIFDRSHEPRGVYSAIRAMAQIELYYNQNFDLARTYFDELINASSKYYPYGPIYASLGLGELNRFSGKLTSANENYKRAITICRGLGGKIETAYAYLGLAEIARAEQDNDSMLSYTREALQIGESVQNPWVIVYGNLISSCAVDGNKETYLKDAQEANGKFKRRLTDINIESQEITRTITRLAIRSGVRPFRFNFL
ncbi:MAG: hypothetical protein ABSC53_03820 [Bacteroidota bacterium]